MIDSDNYAASGIEVIWFPGGEPHVKVPDLDVGHVHIYAKLRTSQDVLAFLAVCSAFEAEGIERHVFMPYLPGARQDRVQNNGAFTAQVYARLFSQACTTLTACDVHSEAASDIYGNYNDLRVISYLPAIEALASGQTYALILCPDSGAVARTEATQRRLGIPNIEYCAKQRDEHGRVSLTVPESVSDANYANCRILIADDICDGGATFLEIEKQVSRKAYTVQIDLYVTHGIFSKGFDSFAATKSFRNFLTTDSFFRMPSSVPPGINIASVNLTSLYLESLTP